MVSVLLVWFVLIDVGVAVGVIDVVGVHGVGCVDIGDGVGVRGCCGVGGVGIRGVVVGRGGVGGGVVAGCVVNVAVVVDTSVGVDISDVAVIVFCRMGSTGVDGVGVVANDGAGVWRYWGWWCYRRCIDWCMYG